MKRELSVSELLQLREEGLSNKQIADRLEISVTTVYQWIGRRSQAVKHAAVQNKPCPIPNPMNIVPVVQKEKGPEKAKEEMPMFQEEKPVQSTDLPATQPMQRDPYRPTLPVLKRREIVDLQGTFCCFRVDTGDLTVEMTDSEGESSALINGLLDKESLGLFIRELMQVHTMLSHP